ncbi:hypothetical protein HFN80_16980 [Rhizobium laguerreae]|uniref:hypothetical protein n=1 Tax=Rhizobium laguerreae TaxID=1076926 RepID=UPI001C90BE66|nr:hypothetical protein [Rhizobium laguerreae]MBY3465687.1 hypothetical protein [Rhizobium laguerreae]
MPAKQTRQRVKPERLRGKVMPDRIPSSRLGGCWNAWFMSLIIILGGGDLASAQERTVVGRANVLLAKDVVLKDAAVCNTAKERPLSVWRELYLGRQRSMRCTDAAAAVEEFQRNSGTDLFNAVGSSPEAQKFSDEYEAACLIKFSAVSDPGGGYTGNRAHSNHLTYMSSPSEIERVKRSVGTLSKIGDRNNCSASLVNLPENKTGMLTAFHCLGQEFPADKPGLSKLGYTNGDVTFRSMSGAQLALSLDGDLTTLEYDAFYGDMVIAPVKAPDPGTYLPVADFAPDLWEPLLLMGVSPFLNARADAQTQIRKLPDLITISLEPYCNVTSRDAGGRLFYGCQTERSQSGGVITVLRDQKFYVVGVHTRGDNKNLESCSADATRSPNSGLSIIMRQKSGG